MIAGLIGEYNMKEEEEQEEGEEVMGNCLFVNPNVAKARYDGPILSYSYVSLATAVLAFLWTFYIHICCHYTNNASIHF